MKTTLHSFSVPRSSALRTASCALLLCACDDFTCEDYATCEPADAGAVREAGASSSATTSSAHDASTGRTSANSNDRSSSESHTTVTSDTAAEIFIDAGASSRQEDASTPVAEQDAGQVSSGHDASAASPDDAALTSPQDSGVSEAKGELGEDCTTNGACQSGHCADGVCCDSACDGVCSACDQTGALGSCSLVEHDDACGSPECPPSTECRVYETTTANANCEAIGECRTESDCQFDDALAGTPCADNTGLCSGSGECDVPDKLSLGEDCDESEECGSGHCALGVNGDTVCCSAACDQTCQVCGSDGQCDVAPANDDACDVVCPENTACTQYPEPPAQTCAGFGVCVAAEQYCQPDHAAAGVECGESSECDGDGQCVVVDRQAPQVVEVTPGNSASNVDRDVVIEITFSEPINSSGLADLFTLNGPDGEVPTTVAMLDDVTVALSPNVTLPLIAPHQLQVSAAIEDLAGNELGDEFESTFTTRDGIWDEEPKLLETENGGDVKLRLSVPVVSDDTPLATDRDGNMLAVWTLPGADNGEDVWYSYFDAEQGSWFEGDRIAATTGVYEPVVIATDEGVCDGLYVRLSFTHSSLALFSGE